MGPSGPKGHIPNWAWRIGALAAQPGAELRFACEACRTVFDVDLGTILAARGPDFRLVNRRPRCKVSCCRGRGFFLVAESRDHLLMPLLTMDPFVHWPPGPRPRDFEPPPFTPTPPSSGPGGASSGAWKPARPTLRIVGGEG